jgi:adenylate cyclase
VLATAGIVLAVGALASGAYRLGLFGTAQLASTDFLFAARPDARPTAAVIVGIDPGSMRELADYGRFSAWPRGLYARVVDNLVAANARVVALDVLFDLPAAEDDELVRSIARAGNVVTPAIAEGPVPGGIVPGRPQVFELLARPIPAIREAAAAEGHVNLSTDADGTLRAIPLNASANGEEVPALALATVARYLRRPRVLDAPPSDGVVAGAARRIPVDGLLRMRVNYLGGPSQLGRPGTFTVVPIADVVDNRFDPALVRDKIVLIGMAAPGFGDEHATPSTTRLRMHGVEVHANAVETILGERYLSAAGPGATLPLVWLAAALPALLLWALRPHVAAVAVAALLVAYILAASFAFDQGLILNMVYPPAALVFGFLALAVYRVVFEQGEQRAIRRTMARYLSPTVSEHVLKDPDLLRLGGERRLMSVLFSDIRGFTTLSHALGAEELVALLNEHLSAMTEIVFRHDGVLDKYIGDAVMAFWGAPIEQPDHARRAVSTALEMIDRLLQLRDDWQRRGLPQLDIGIGINTGEMIVGNTGSQEHLAYTVLGDAVNVASRLEGLSKQYHVRLVVGDATRQAAGPDFAYRFLDVVAVKGRPEPLPIYEVLGPKARVDEQQRRLLEAYDAGVELYRSRRWVEADRALQHALTINPADGPSLVYRGRIAELAESPPPADWDGVYVARTK